MLCRQPHPVEHEAIQQLGVCRQALELSAGHKQPGDAVVAELLRFVAVEVIKVDQRTQVSPSLLSDIADELEKNVKCSSEVEQETLVML